MVGALCLWEYALVFELSVVLVEIGRNETAVSNPLLFVGIKYWAVAEEPLHLVGSPLFVMHCQLILLVDLKELFSVNGFVDFYCVFYFIVISCLLFEKRFDIVPVVIFRPFFNYVFIFCLLGFLGFGQIELSEDIDEIIIDLDFQAQNLLNSRSYLITWCIYSKQHVASEALKFSIVAHFVHHWVYLDFKTIASIFYC